MQNDRLLRALQRKPVDCTPIWLMRQAGRYLPEYCQTKARAGDMLTLFQTPELACGITLQPLQRFDLDAAIIFSDILTIPDAMGLGLYFVAGEGPCFEWPVRSAADVKSLKMPDPEVELRYVMDAIRMVSHELRGRVPLIGFSGSPWTLAAYMIEGKSSKTFNIIKKFMYQEPKVLHLLLEHLTKAITLYLNAQIAAGAQVIMLFDSWGGILTTPDYQQFSLDYMTQIISNIKRQHQGRTIPTILFTRNGNQWLKRIVNSGCDAVSIDWTLNLNIAKKHIGDRVALQGNMDPAILYASPNRIREEVSTILNNFGDGDGHIFNLGHGVYKDTPHENVGVLVDAVHEMSLRSKKN